MELAVPPSLVSLDTTSTTTHLLFTAHTLSDSLQIQRHSVPIARTQAELQVVAKCAPSACHATCFDAYPSHLQLRLCPLNSNAVTLNLEGI